MLLDVGHCKWTPGVSVHSKASSRGDPGAGLKDSPRQAVPATQKHRSKNRIWIAPHGDKQETYQPENLLNKQTGIQLSGDRDSIERGCFAPQMRSIVYRKRHKTRTAGILAGNHSRKQYVTVWHQCRRSATNGVIRQADQPVWPGWRGDFERRVGQVESDIALILEVRAPPHASQLTRANDFRATLVRGGMLSAMPGQTGATLTTNGTMRGGCERCICRSPSVHPPE